jgi:hypothetical protein
MSEAEQELVAGFHTEYGGLRYALFANAEYVHLISISSLGVTFFLGGWTIPGWSNAPFLLGLLSFFVKLGIFLFGFIWIRATLPRLRYDRLMRFGWKVMLPAATLQFLVTAIIVGNGWGSHMKSATLAAAPTSIEWTQGAAKSNTEVQFLAQYKQEKRVADTPGAAFGQNVQVVVN